MKRSPAIILVSLLAAACADDAERTASTRSAIVEGEPSTTAEDFIVFVARKHEDPAKVSHCGGTLVAPNLVLTAKHCVYEWLHDSRPQCDASGEPVFGGTGGYVTGDVPPGEIVVYTGVIARARYRPPPGEEPDPPDAVGKEVFDDRTPTLCSHDLAYLLLDRAITNMPIGRLRLGKRPEPGTMLAVGGWGRAENGPPFHGGFSPARRRRGGISVQRVGPPIAPANATGDLGPRIFETGPGGCTEDSGGPGFDEGSGAVFGVLVRALNLDPSSTVSPCAPDTVRNVYMLPSDFEAPLREAFAAAGAEPWLEGKDQPGFLRWGEACGSDAECEGGKCAGAVCNVACKKEGRACPEGYACAASSGACEVPPPPVPPPPPPPPPAEGEETIDASGGCSSAPGGAPSPPALAWAALALGACVACARRIRQASSRL